MPVCVLAPAGVYMSIVCARMTAGFSRLARVFLSVFYPSTEDFSLRPASLLWTDMCEFARADQSQFPEAVQEEVLPQLPISLSALFKEATTT